VPLVSGRPVGLGEASAVKTHTEPFCGARQIAIVSPLIHDTASRSSVAGGNQR
jgi:hypothetical protein